jgi:hypothetical protein
MPWLCPDGFCDGRFWGELDVKSTSEAGFCRFWTRGLLLLAPVRKWEVPWERPSSFVALLTAHKFEPKNWLMGP